MDMMFLALGIIDLIAGGILWFEASLLVKTISALIITKGVVTIFRSIKH